MNTGASIDTAIRAFSLERRYATATIDRWLRLTPPDRTALLELAQDLRPSEKQLLDLWEWAEEIAQRDGTSVAVVLSLPALTTALQRRLSRNDRLKQLKGALRRLRYPQLSAAEDRLRTLVRSLGLPPSVRIIPPEHLEGDELRIEIVARNAATLQGAITRLAAAMQPSTCNELFDLLGELPEP